MPWRDPQIWNDLRILFLAFVTAISGGAGGGLIASVYVLHRRIDTVALALAHVFVGFCSGFAMFVAAPWIPGLGVNGIQDALLAGVITGAAASVGLAGSSVVVRIALKRLGINMEIHIKTDRDRNWQDSRSGD